MRGWSHAAAAVGAVATTVGLILACQHDWPRAISMLVYGLSMCALFAVSSCYHLGRWPAPWGRRLQAGDHASIFILIAGTYTPVAFNVLTGWERVAVLAAIWVLAVAGVTLCVSRRLPRWANVGLYVGMGWVALLPAPSLLRTLPPPANLTLAAGGILYSVGALVYGLRRPDPLPRIFGFHEIFHLFVIAGAAAFALAIWLWVVPFPRV